jgi:hypothetical protein
MHWEAKAKESFDAVLNKIPSLLRTVAEKKVAQKAEDLAKTAGRTQISEKDIVDAFFVVTPFGFHGPMKTDMETLGIDYQKYGHQK